MTQYRVLARIEYNPLNKSGVRMPTKDVTWEPGDILDTTLCYSKLPIQDLLDRKIIEEVI